MPAPRDSGAATSRPPTRPSRTRTQSSMPIVEASLRDRLARTRGRSGGTSPCSAASTGSAKISNVSAADTGTYTLPWVERVLGDRPVAVVRLVHREQGLIVAAGNPLGLGGIEDLTRPGLRYVNRQRGAGTRVLLDHELGRRGIAAEAVGGYAREEHTHLAVAAAVAAGRADCGLGVLAAARAFGLGFVPVTREPYDLVMAAETVDDPVLAPLWDLLASRAFLERVEALGGYSTAESGRRVR